MDSLKSIIAHGLMSRGSLGKNHINYIDTADHDILLERERLGLSQYIPFHFHFHTAYDTAVKNNNSNRTFIYICLSRDYARRNNFLILPIHPASNEQPELLAYGKGLEEIDWDTMELTIPEAQNKGVDLRYHRQVRMAECLSPFTISAENFQSINVPDDVTKEQVERLLDLYNIRSKPHINIRNWFV